MVKFTIAPLLLIPAILSAVVLATPVKRQGVETVVQQLVADIAGLNTAASSVNRGLTFNNALVKLTRAMNRREFELSCHRNLIKESKLLIVT